MKKLLTLLLLAFLSSCGQSKTEEQALTPEQESSLVDSVTQDLTNYTEDLNQKADSVTADVDSLLQGI